MPPSYTPPLLLPSPSTLTAEGYTARWLPDIDSDAAKTLAVYIHTAISDPAAWGDQDLVRYVLRWKEEFNNANAARIDELEEVDLSTESAQKVKPHIHFRRLAELRAIQNVPFEEFNWLMDSQGAKGPRTVETVELRSKVHHVLVLTDSHQLALAGSVLKNCVGSASYREKVRNKRTMVVLLSSTREVQDAVALGQFKEQWFDMRETCNKAADKTIREAFKQVTDKVLPIWQQSKQKYMPGDNNFDLHIGEWDIGSQLKKKLRERDMNFREFRMIVKTELPRLPRQGLPTLGKELITRWPKYFGARDYIGLHLSDFVRGCKLTHLFS